MSEITNLKKKLEKVSKGVHVSVMSESDLATHHEVISTPALDLNRTLSGSVFGRNKG